MSDMKIHEQVVAQLSYESETNHTEMLEYYNKELIRVCGVPKNLLAPKKQEK